MSESKDGVKGATAENLDTETDPDGWMRTISGEMIFLPEPDPARIHIEDMARALAMQCRYNGHVKAFASVAQHCVFVARALAIWGHSRRLQLLGLIHDGAETYDGDVIRGMKRICPDVQKLEAAATRAIYEALGISPPTPEEEGIVKEADNAVMAIESMVVRPWQSVASAAPTRKVNGLIFDSWAWQVAEQAFLHQWAELRC